MKNPLSFTVLAALFLLLSINYSRAQIITSFASGIGDCRNAAIYARLNYPGAVDVDASGNVFIADNLNSCLRKVDAATGIINTVYHYTSSNHIAAMTHDAAGNLYLAYAYYVIRLTPAGAASTYAGTGGMGLSGDGGQATAAALGSTNSIAIDGSGNLYLSDYTNGRIRKVNTSGIITTVAGGGTGGDGIAAILTLVDHPLGVVVDGAGNIYFSEEYTGKIRKVNTAGIVSTYATGTNCRQLTIDAAGNIYGTSLFSVRKVNTSGVVSLFAGGALGFGGDGGPATAAGMYEVMGVKIDAAGNAYIVDRINNRIRRVNTSGIIKTFAGNGLTLSGVAGDGGQALLATFNAGALATDRSGNVFITDALNQYVRKIAATGIVSTVAGSGILGFGGDGGPAISAILGNPSAVTSDKAGNFYIGDVNTSHIRKVNTAGIISTIGGGGTSGLGDGGPATAAQMSVANIASDSVGNIYIADVPNQRIRKITAATGIITTIAGNGTAGFAGDNGPAIAATVNYPGGLAVDRTGNLFFGDNGDRIRKIDIAGTITTAAGGGTIPVDNGPATSAILSAPNKPAIDKWGNVYFFDLSHRVFKMDNLGYLHVVAGSGGAWSIGDCGPATNAGIADLTSISVDTSGNLYIMDGTFIRKVCCMTNTTGHPAVFTHATDQNMSVCASAPATAIDTFLAISGPLPGSHITWSVYSAPLHGSLGGFTTTLTTAGGTTTPSGMTYTPASGYAGTDNFVVKVSDGNYSNYMRIVVSISAMPTAITGPGTLCVGNTATFTGAGTGGTWSSNNTLIATVGTPTGLVTGASAGTARISYTLSGLCSISTIVTVNNAVAPIAGTTSICMATPATLSSSPGGTWTSSDLSKATIGSSSGIVTPVAIGTATISYILSSSCYTAAVITVNPLPDAGSISGPSAVCAGATIAMSNPATGGVWSVTNSHASVSSAGIVTGVSAGTVNVSYTVTNGCGVTADVHPVTVNPLPAAGAISGTMVLCPGNSTILSNPTAIGSGAWSSPSPYISISAGAGIVSGIAAGTALVSYSSSNSCGTATATAILTVSPIPVAGSISGITSICTGGTSALSSSVPGGVWSSGNPFVAPVSSAGVVSGNAAGAALISYSVSSPGCGSSVAVAIVNIAAATPILPVTGPGSMCSGTTVTLSDASLDGTWSSSNPSVATVSASGVVTGVSDGVATISYSANLGCGLSVATSNMVVHPAPDAGVITGTATICTGADDLLTSTALGGVWSSSNAHATVSPTGLVTGATVGTSTISYTVTNSCGSASATHSISVYLTPVAGSISGVSALCAGTSSAFTNTSGSSGGLWSTSDATVATVSGTGALTAVAVGTVALSYTVTTGCGIAYATKIVTVNAPNPGIVTGVTTFCAGGSGLLNSTVTGGTWSTGIPTVATINSAGMVTAIAGGTAIVSYTVSGACGLAVGTVNITVGSLPVVSPIVGVPAICAGSTAAFTNGTSAGSWSSSNPLVASIGTSGIVTGLTEGTAVISYMVTAGCGTAGAVATLNVQTSPLAASISGLNAVCAGSAITLVPGIAGGTWSSSNILVATTGTAGIVTGTGPGSAAITYTNTNTCGSITTTKDITVDVLTAGTITGAAELCPGGTASLINSLPGGTWSSGTPIITVSTTGNVAALSSGIAVVLYSITNSCGLAEANHLIVVAPIPDAGIISGASALCTGLSTPMSVSGSIGTGSWSSSNTLIATVGSTGIVAGIAPGTIALSYTVNNACGAATATKDMTINLLTAGAINGITALCPGGYTTLSSTVTGGTWASSDPTVATISAGGLVTALAAGATVISYSVTGPCGTVTETIVFTVSSLPIVLPTDGDNDICFGTTTVYSNPTIGGVWSSSDLSVASVSAAGLVTGIAPGTCIISYTVIAGCGAAGSAITLKVAGTPLTGTVSGNVPVCAGNTILLQSSVAGGTWAIGNPLIAAVDELTGAVTGLSAGTVAVTYTFTNSCGSANTVVVEPVITLPDAGGISGATSVCEQSAIMLADAVSDGVWSSSNAAVATVSSQGEVTGVAQGTVIISYAVTNQCGTSYAKATLNVNRLPFIPAIAGAQSVTKGATALLSNSVPGGNWGSNNAAVATINADGLLSGISEGAATITYAVTNNFGCNSFITALVQVTTDSIGKNIRPNIDLNVYPNPATNAITISWEKQIPANADVRIMDIAARDVLETSFTMASSRGTAQIDIAGISAGVYTITIRSANENYTGKLVILK